MQKYKFKKGDTPDKVARAFGHRNFGPIWSHAKNRSMKSKRKTDTALVAGDSIFIPFNDTERSQIHAEIGLWTVEIANEASLQVQLSHSILAVRERLKNLTTARANVQSSFKSALQGLLGGIKILRKAKDAKKITSVIDITSGIAAAAMNEVGRISKLAQSEGTEFKKFLTGDLKTVGKSSGVAASESKSAMGVISGFMDSVSEVASTVSKEVGSAVTTKYWKDLLIYGDLELMDLDKAKSETEKKLMTSINKLRKAAALTDVGFKGLLAATKVKQKLLETALSGCQKRLKSAETSLKSLPKLADLKNL